MELERSGGQAESSSNGMAIEAIMMNDEEAWDDVRRGWLDREKVREARLEAVGHMERKKLWDEVSRSAASGHRTVSVKWVDTNKGTEENPEKRCSLVARDFRGPSKDREDLFAATPPWELKKLPMSHAADRSDGKTRKMLLIDVKKAHLNSECTEDVQAQALALRIPTSGGGVGSALRNQAGGSRLREGVGDARIFLPRREGRQLGGVEELMSGWYDVKVRARLGPDDHDDKEATLLGRMVRWQEW